MSRILNHPKQHNAEAFFNKLRLLIEEYKRVGGDMNHIYKKNSKSYKTSSRKSFLTLAIYVYDNHHIYSYAYAYAYDVNTISHIIKILIDAGCDVNIKDGNNRTAISMLLEGTKDINKKKYNLILYLLEIGAVYKYNSEKKYISRYGDEFLSRNIISINKLARKDNLIFFACIDRKNKNFFSIGSNIKKFLIIASRKKFTMHINSFLSIDILKGANA